MAKIIRIFTAILLCFSFAWHLKAQHFIERENSTTSSNRYISISFQNDLPYKTDYYFSNGILVAIVFPELGNLPVAKLFPKPAKGSLNYYGLEIVQNIYTPIRLYWKDVVYFDRPFASELYLSYSQQSFSGKSKTNREIFVGLIGKYSFGQQIQSKFHEAINNKVPPGWKYQIKTDPIINYNFNSEQEIYSLPFAELHYNWGFRAGTLFDDLNLGTTIRIGYFNRYYSGLGQAKRKSEEGANPKQFQIYVYCNPEAKFIVYNALLEGGIFNKMNIFELQPTDIEPIVYQIKTGAVLQYRFIQILAETNYLSREIKTGRPHQWVNIGFSANF